MKFCKNRSYSNGVNGIESSFFLRVCVCVMPYYNVFSSIATCTHGTTDKYDKIES